MKAYYRITLLLSFIIFLGCGGKEEKKKKGFTYEETKTESKAPLKETESNKASKQIDLSNKGIGPIKTVALNTKIDEKMVAHGKATFTKLCAACHRPDKKFIGPSPKDILERRSPEWVMNIMLNPIEMIEKDPITKALQEEFNGAIMPKQNITEADARALLEYFRTL
ncbi:c-type cytochrome [Seonamhaeicola marinus]|uniref:Cytochrome c n=1 Tax=Seonamhaeicola marinus TaxID=1912246 RepID=A0A5D0HVF7_9FLAO|nr:cytochrome c [Seonamhaeicola marinus]TYA74489.1 cytochrome c [Seonamhaeicola marinus]